MAKGYAEKISVELLPVLKLVLNKFVSPFWQPAEIVAGQMEKARNFGGFL